MTDVAFYHRSAALSVRALQRFGEPATMQRSTGHSDYDPETGTASASGAQSWPCIALMADYETRDIDGALIQASDRLLLVAPDIAEAPKPGDVFELTSGRVTAIRVKPLAPGGIVVLYEVQVRGE